MVHEAVTELIERPTIPRSDRPLDPESFKHVLPLFLTREWLRDRSEEFAELWNLCTSKEQHDLVFDLLSRFTVLTSNDVGRACRDLVRQITETWKLSPQTTRILAAADDRNSDGSQLVLYYLRSQMAYLPGWQEKHFLSNFAGINDYPKSVKNIVLVDDFIGSGNKITDKIKWIKERLADQNRNNIALYACSIGAMRKAQQIVEDADAGIHSSHWYEKSISEYYTGTALSTMKLAMKELEKQLSSRHNGQYIPRFGYGSSESIFCLDQCNVPNNVFPIFWWPTLKGSKPRKTIFRRMR